MHVTEAQGIRSIAQMVHVSSYPLEGDDSHECSSETECQTQEPEDIHADADSEVNCRLNIGDPIFACSLGCNLPQELNAFLSREEVVF